MIDTSNAARLLALACAYFAAGWLGLQIPYTGSHITLVWLPTGIAVAALLRWGMQAWPAVYAAAFLVNLSIGSTWMLAAAIAIGNTLAPVLSVRLLRHAGFDAAFSHRRDVGLLLAAAAAGMTASASCGVVSLYLAGLMPPESMDAAWLSWWMGDTIGVLLGAPFLLAARREGFRQLWANRRAVASWLLVAVPVAWLAFIEDFSRFGRNLPLAFTTLPLFAWAALRFGNVGAAFAGLAFSVVAAWSTAAGRGTFHLADPHLSLFLLWAYMAIIVLTGLLITALQAERAQAERSLRESEEKLRALFELSPLGIALTDMNGRYVEFNEAFRNITGYSARELVALDYWALTPKKYADDEERQLESLRRTGRYGPYEKEYVRKDGSLVPLRLIGMLLTRGNGDQYIWSIVEDVTERRAAEDEIRYLAFHDPLTRLPNRRLLVDRLRRALLLGKRHPRQGALLFIDLDNFKTLNDSQGHDKGDLLLQEVARRLPACVRESDTVARLGGDEFVVMLEDLGEKTGGTAAHAEQVGNKVLAALRQPFVLDGYEYHSTASIGIALFGDREETVDELLKQADLAMYQAKSAGRNAIRFFDPQMQAAVSIHLAMERDLRNALRDNQITLHYQAQADSANRVTGAEVLARWLHPQRGMVMPNEFIPLAEETGLILPLGRSILEHACRQLAAWASLPETAHLTLAVNVSVQQLRQPDFVEQVTGIIDATGANPRRLKLELTESLLMDNVEDTIAKMNALKAIGIGFALDDFGTGYSSLSYLKRLPLEKLKIDRSFVRDVLTDPNDAAIARTVVALARSLGLDVIAEGVETEEQRRFLANNGCHAYQGYLFSRPLPLAEFEAFRSSREQAIAAE